MVLFRGLDRGGMIGQIKVATSAITKDEQIDIARLLVKAGNTVSVKKVRS